MQTGILLKKIEGFFLSRRVAVVLLVITLALLVLSTRFPDITTVTNSPFFLILPLLIFLSTLICTLNRLRRRSSRPPGTASFTVKKTVITGNGWDEARAVDYLVKKGWRHTPPLNPLPQGEGRDMVLNKGGQGFWGSMVFHAGLLLMLTAAAVTSATLFRAELLLTAGLPASLGREGFLKIWREPLVPLSFQEGEMVLHDFKAVYRDERFPVDYVAKVEITGSGSRRTVDVRVNEPLKLGQIHYTMDKYGFAPGFLIKDRHGDTLFDGYVSLDLLGGAEDYFEIPGTDINVLVRFFPDFVMTDKGPSTRSRTPNNPVFGLRVKRGDTTGKGKLVRMGKEADMEGLLISPIDLRYWSHFAVARDLGQPLFLISFALIASGLIFRFAYYEKWLRVSYLKTKEGGSGVEVSGYSRYFPALFEGELERIADEIGREKC